MLHLSKLHNRFKIMKKLFKNIKINDYEIPILVTDQLLQFEEYLTSYIE